MNKTSKQYKMKRLIILNGQLIFPDRIDTGKALICKNGKIEQILADKMLEINPDDQIIDAKQQYVISWFYRYACSWRWRT